MNSTMETAINLVQFINIPVISGIIIKLVIYRSGTSTLDSIKKIFTPISHHLLNGGQNGGLDKLNFLFYFTNQPVNG
ncbi:TPA: hypothetical protein LC430_004878 [Salmonella enterica subsp. enterica serovar Duisburg]|nr:hypothetical protein [Salmonella enterica subsp. enterica serovar Duisburg]